MNLPVFIHRQNYVFTESEYNHKINLSFIEKKNKYYQFKSKEIADKQFPFHSALPPNHYVVMDENGKNIVMQYESESFVNNKYTYAFSFVNLLDDIIQYYKAFQTYLPPSTKYKFSRDSHVFSRKGHNTSYRSNALNPSKAVKKKGGTRRRRRRYP